MRTLDIIAQDVSVAAREDEIPALEALLRELQDHASTDRPTIDGLTLFVTASTARLVGDITGALSIFTQALELFTRIHEQQWMGEVHAQIGMLHVKRGDPDLAHQALARALDVFHQINDRAAVARTLTSIGIVNLNYQDPSSAMERLQQAVRIHEDIGNEDGIIDTLFNIGTVYQRIGDYPAALANYHRCLSHFEQHGASRSIANAYNNIAIVHYNMEEFGTALDYFERALELHRANGQEQSVSYLFMNIGNCYMGLGNTAGAMEHFQAALVIAERSGEDHGGVAIRLKIINQLGKESRFEEVDAALRELEAMNVPNKEHQITILMYRSRLQAILSGDLSGAFASCLAALEIASATSARRTEAECHRQLRDIALDQQDLAAYVEHNAAYIKIKEEISGKQTATTLTAMQKQREIDAREREHQKHLAVLHSTLPKHIADRVARGEVVNDHFENASVIFLDIVGFTDLSSSMSSQDVITLLDNIFTQCDAICEQYNVTKIKTIGDSYMAVAFETANTEQRTAISVVRAANAAIEMMNVTLNEELTKALEKVLNKPVIEFRIGMHCGPVTAGVIGTQRMQYDVWGDTVNVASRMESTSEPGKIQISEAFAALLPATTLGDSVERPMQVVERGEIEVKGKGMMKTYWLE
ncbi:MAG: tetratricopeptide repeat protein [Ignavibacteria bacterium]|nr:tetratricopeptide repeat protein [Ignavibacteria bacterium]